MPTRVYASCQLNVTDAIFVADEIRAAVAQLR